MLRTDKSVSGFAGVRIQIWFTKRPSLKRRGLSVYGTGVGSVRRVMARRLSIILSIVVLGLILNGCTKCGPIWDDWMQSPKSCK
jgi:hypothetical protein